MEVDKKIILSTILRRKKQNFCRQEICRQTFFLSKKTKFMSTNFCQQEISGQTFFLSTEICRQIFFCCWQSRLVDDSVDKIPTLVTRIFVIFILIYWKDSNFCNICHVQYFVRSRGVRDQSLFLSMPTVSDSNGKLRS